MFGHDEKWDKRERGGGGGGEGERGERERERVYVCEGERATDRQRSDKISERS